jgi:outer membrane protein assembly factor BamB
MNHKCPWRPPGTGAATKKRASVPRDAVDGARSRVHDRHGVATPGLSAPGAGPFRMADDQMNGVRMTRCRAAVVMALASLASTVVSADDTWPQFRGAQAGVAADDPSLPDVWGPSQNIVWKIDVPGRSWSSPVVWGDHVFITSAINTVETEKLLPTSAYVSRSNGGTMTFRDIATPSAPHRWMVYDIDFRSGKTRWEHEVARAVPTQPRHLKNSYASETPVTDGERLYAYFGNVGLFAFDMNGKLLWSRPMEALKVRSGFGPASSPVVAGNRVFILSDNDEQSFIAAFDARTGAEVWRVNRKEGSNWTSPYVWKNDRRTEIVTAGSDRVRSYDVDGKLLWELAGMASFDVPTPFAANGLLYVTSGYPADKLRPAYAIRPGASGDISLKPDQTTNDYIVWSQPTLGPFHPSTLVYGGCYYTLLDRGILTCNDPENGREIYPKQRVSADATGFTASPWAYNGKVFLMSEDGDTYVIQAGAEYKLLRKNSLDEMTLASPAVANGSVIIRTATKLYRIARQ